MFNNWTNKMYNNQDYLNILRQLKSLSKIMVYMASNLDIV